MWHQRPSHAGKAHEKHFTADDDVLPNQESIAINPVQCRFPE
jgi:hypothetical protein